MIEANIKADAAPAANAMRMIAIISCPAPFERLEARDAKPQPSATGRTRSLMNECRGRLHGCRPQPCLANNVGKQPEEAHALDGAGELTLLLGGHSRDAARHDLAALGDVTHQQLGILVVDLRRVRPRERASLATAEKRTTCTSFSHDPYSPPPAVSASSRGRRGPRSPRNPPPSRSPRNPPPSRSPRNPPPPRSSRSRSRSALRIIADGPSSCSSTRTER